MAIKMARAAEVKRVMREVFGFEKFRFGQAEVVKSVLERGDTIAVMPTGAGKSLCYQLPGLLLPGITIVVSPLIALMKDQVEKLEGFGVSGSQVNSMLTVGEEREAIEAVEEERSEFVFTTPERITNPEFLRTLEEHEVDLFVVDEAHCISEWGHDFRPAFLELKNAIAALGRPPVLALTATATDEVIADIRKNLYIPDAHLINTGIYRANLRFEVRRTTNALEKREQIAEILRKNEGAGVIYTATVKACDEIYEWLKEQGSDPAKYNGKMPARERKENQEQFMNGERRVIVATNAFGMGIDKPDIRFVIHYQIPGSLEAYYQEAGRAGRDGEEACCTLLYDTTDHRTQMFFIGGRHPTSDDVLEVCRALEQLDAHAEPAALARVQEMAAGVAKNKVRVVLAELKDAGIVREIRGARFRLLRTDLTGGELDRFTSEFARKAEADRAKIERMMIYAQTAHCRWRALLEYFDDEEAEDCGCCDNCHRPAEERRASNTRIFVAMSDDDSNASSASAADEARETVAALLAAANADAEQADAGSSRNDDARTATRTKRSTIKKGDVVRLPKYGQGRVQAIEDDKLVISFPGAGVYKFKKEFVKPQRRNSTRPAA